MATDKFAHSLGQAVPADGFSRRASGLARIKARMAGFILFSSAQESHSIDETTKFTVNTRVWREPIFCAPVSSSEQFPAANT